MFGKQDRSIIVMVVVAVGLFFVAAGQSLSLASPSLSPSLMVTPQNNFTLSLASVGCSSFNFRGFTAANSGFAAVRIWKGSAGSANVLVDSYVANNPSYFAPIQNNQFSGSVSFPAQPSGTQLTARIYHAPTNVPSSYDTAIPYVDVVASCFNGVKNTDHIQTCSTTGLSTQMPSATGPGYFTTDGISSFESGYATLRIWANGTPLVDSFVPGFPTAYAHIANIGTYSISAQFTAQPTGTTMLARVYHAPQSIYGSYDGTGVSEYAWTC